MVTVKASATKAAKATAMPRPCAVSCLKVVTSPVVSTFVAVLAAGVVPQRYTALVPTSGLSASKATVAAR